MRLEMTMRSIQKFLTWGIAFFLLGLLHIGEPAYANPLREAYSHSSVVTTYRFWSADLLHPSLVLGKLVVENPEARVAGEDMLVPVEFYDDDTVKSVAITESFVVRGSGSRTFFERRFPNLSHEFLLIFDGSNTLMIDRLEDGVVAQRFLENSIIPVTTWDPEVYLKKRDRLVERAETQGLEFEGDQILSFDFRPDQRDLIVTAELQKFQSGEIVVLTHSMNSQGHIRTTRYSEFVDYHGFTLPQVIMSETINGAGRLVETTRRDVQYHNVDVNTLDEVFAISEELRTSNRVNSPTIIEALGQAHSLPSR